MRADTQNFIIYSEGNEKSLRKFAENLQRFDSTLRFRFNIANRSDPYRLTIFLVPQASDAGRLATGKGGSSIAGFYSATLDHSYAVSHREEGSGLGTSQAQQTLYHEYTHHFMKRYVPIAFPAWFIEGFAEYFSTVDFTKDGLASIGKPAYRRAYGLLELPKIPAEQLLAKRPTEMKNSGQMDVYYGRAWLLTHMLYADPTRVGQLGTYMDAINKGEEAATAAAEAFGDLAQLDKDLNRYVNRPISYRNTKEPIPLAGTVTITSLSDAEDALLPLRLERLSAKGDSERLAAVRADLQKLSGLHPEAAGVWYELAEADWAFDRDDHDLSAVRSAVDKALALEPTHARANVLFGRLLAKEQDKKGDYSATAWRDVRKPIALANRTNPDDPVPLYDYFRSFTDQRVRPPEIAIQGLERAFLLAPENISVRVSYAFSLANQGKYEDALKLAKTVAFDPHDGGDGERLLRQIESIRDRRQGRAEAESATGVEEGASEPDE